MNTQMKFISTIAIMLLLTVGVTMLFPGCGDKKSPTDPGLPKVECPIVAMNYDMSSFGLLSRPVVSKEDNYIYYHDTGIDQAYFDAWLEDPFVNPWPAEGMVPGIYRINPADESPAELVAEYGEYPEFSPDGKTLLFIRDGIWRIRLPDGEPELIDERPFADAKWFSEDTLVVKIPMNPNIYMLDLITDSVHVLSGLTGIPDVSSDRKILYYYYENGDVIGIYDFDADSSWLLRPDVVQGIPEIHWAPDGKQIVFIGYSPEERRQDIWIIDMNGRQLRLPFFPGGDARISPDGRHITFVRNPFANCSICRANQVWMRLLDGSNTRQVTAWPRIRP